MLNFGGVGDEILPSYIGMIIYIYIGLGMIIYREIIIFRGLSIMELGDEELLITV